MLIGKPSHHDITKLKKTISFHLLCWKCSQGNWFLHRVWNFSFDTLKANWALVSSPHTQQEMIPPKWLQSILVVHEIWANVRGSLKIDDYGRFFNVGMVGAKWGFLNLPTLIPLHLCMHQQLNNQHIHSVGRTHIYQEEPTHEAICRANVRPRAKRLGCSLFPITITSTNHLKKN
jgi:hypothetical protein